MGRRTPVRQLKKVLLPAPFGPMIARISPRATAKLTLLSAVSPPKRIVRSDVRNSVAAAPSWAVFAGDGAASNGSAVTYAAKLQAGGTIVLSFATTSLMW